MHTTTCRIAAMTAGLLILLAPRTAAAAIHAAAGCSQVEVGATIAAASVGDTVTVPAGEAAWTGMAIDKAIHLRGAGTGLTRITISGNTVTKQATGPVTISGFTFTRTGGGNASKGFHIGGDWPGAEPVVFRDNAFAIDGSGLFRIAVAGGVIFARNTFTGGWDDSFIQFNGSEDTAGSWSTADTMGERDTTGRRNVYIEDNTFTGGTNQGIDADFGGRIVCRHNTFTHSSFNTHGFATSLSGVRHFEIYGNTFIHDGGTDQLANQNWAVWIRGGTGVIFDNHFDDLAGTYWGDKAEIKLTIRGAEDAPPPGSIPPVAYPVPRQLGQSHDGTGSSTDPIHIWGNSGSPAIAAGWNWGNPHGLDFDDYFQWGRDGVRDGSAKPGYVPYAYPHPLLDGPPPLDGLPPLPEGPGLAAAYPGDSGIADDPAVLFAEDFEAYAGERISWSEIGGWDNIYGDLVITRHAADVHAGRQALQVTHLQPQTHGAVKQVPGQDTLFIRYYQKFSAGFPGCHHTGCSIRGGTADALWDNPTGQKPDGTNHFVASFDHLSPLHGWDPPENDAPPGWSYNYCYHMDQGSDYGDVLLPSGPLQGGDLLGDDFVPRANVTPPLDRWLCCELMLHCNTPGQRGGRVAMWIDGVLVADHPNLRFRTVTDLKARFATLSTYSSQVQSDKVLWYDDLVVATSYIGPMTSASGAPQISSASASPDPVTGTQTMLQVEAHDPDGDPLTYSWVVATRPDGATPQIGSGEDPTVTFDRSGSYAFQVTVSDGRGGTDRAVVTVHVAQSPTALEVAP